MQIFDEKDIGRGLPDGKYSLQGSKRTFEIKRGLMESADGFISPVKWVKKFRKCFEGKTAVIYSA